MTPNRISELLAPFLGNHCLSEVQLAEISTYTELLVKWNAHISLTSVRDQEEIITRHFGESLFTARQLLSADAESLKAIDVGSGAGFPGLPLKIWNPGLSLTLIEAHGKKAVFLREVARALELSGVKVFADRAENLKDQADLVVLRAVERFEKILPVAANLVAPAGRLALLISDTQIETARSIRPETKWENPVALPLSRGRSLLVGRFPASG
jgi:16S rRNA (guanine527-N7)-methyltransferase